MDLEDTRVLFWIQVTNKYPELAEIAFENLFQATIL